MVEHQRSGDAPREAKRIFILCAGSANRWNGGCKQLCRIGDETLIERTIRLIREQDSNLPVCIVTWRPELHQPGCEYLDTKDATDSLASTILLTEPRWADMNYLLTGDTLFDSESIRTILKSNTTTIFGTWNHKGIHERFAASFPGPMNAMILNNLQRAIEDKMVYKSIAANDLLCLCMYEGVRFLYRWHMHTKINRLVHPPNRESDVKRLTGKLFYTVLWLMPGHRLERISADIRDFDTPEEYTAFLDQGRQTHK